MSRPYCNELWVIKSVKSSDVCSPSGLSGSLQKVLLRALMDWMKCEFSQPSRLVDFPWTHLQSPRVCNWVNVLIFGFSLSWSVVCSVLPLVVQHQPDPFYHPVSPAFGSDSLRLYLVLVLCLAFIYFISEAFLIFHACVPWVWAPFV